MVVFPRKATRTGASRLRAVGGGSVGGSGSRGVIREAKGSLGAGFVMVGASLSDAGASGADLTGSDGSRPGAGERAPPVREGSTGSRTPATGAIVRGSAIGLALCVRQAAALAGAVATTRGKSGGGSCAPFRVAMTDPGEEPAGTAPPAGNDNAAFRWG